MPLRDTELARPPAPVLTRIRRGWKWFALRIFIVLALLAAGTYGVTWITAAPPVQKLEVTSSVGLDFLPRGDGLLRVMTLNLAHGRSTRLHQLLERRKTIQENLHTVAAVVRKVEPDVLGLQEADGPSLWSGGFDHVQYLADATRFTHVVRAEHVRGLVTSYGTALLSQYPLKDPVAITFPPSPPTFSKGFVMADVQWPGREDVWVRVISVHTDFSRDSVIAEQAQALIDTLDGYKGPLVLMGDINSYWDQENSVPRRICRSLKLKAWNPTDTTPPTVSFPLTDRRLDWILISKEMEFVEHRTLGEAISDHRAVTATLRLRDDPAEK